MCIWLVAGSKLPCGNGQPPCSLFGYFSGFWQFVTPSWIARFPRLPTIFLAIHDCLLNCCHSSPPTDRLSQSCLCRFTSMTWYLTSSPSGDSCFTVAALPCALLYFLYDGTYGNFCHTPTIAMYLQHGLHTVDLLGTTPPMHAYGSHVSTTWASYGTHIFIT